LTLRHHGVAEADHGDALLQQVLSRLLGAPLRGEVPAVALSSRKTGDASRLATTVVASP
jgi:hypothetical protein